MGRHRLANLHLYKNSSNLYTAFLHLFKDMGGQMAQFGGNRVIVGAYRQGVLFKSDHPAGLRQRRWDGLPVKLLQGSQSFGFLRHAA
jgi:hypothetical protein